jgi:hypothetical protein
MLKYSPMETAHLIDRLRTAGPLLFLGLAMLLDAVGFVGCFRKFTDVVRRFQSELRLWHHTPVWHRSLTWDRGPVTPRIQFAIRTAGALLSAFAFLVIAIF